MRIVCSRMASFFDHECLPPHAGQSTGAALTSGNPANVSRSASMPTGMSSLVAGQRKLPERVDIGRVELDLRQGQARVVDHRVVGPPVDGQCRCRVEPDRGHGVECHGAAQHAHRSTRVLVNGQIRVCETDELAVDSVRRQRCHPTSPPRDRGAAKQHDPPARFHQRWTGRPNHSSLSGDVSVFQHAGLDRQRMLEDPVGIPSALRFLEPLVVPAVVQLGPWDA